MKIYPYNIAGNGNEDWAKATLDFAATNADDLRFELDDLGWTVAKFKESVGYHAALASGNYPWLADL